jgi:hypothetical protein
VYPGFMVGSVFPWRPSFSAGSGSAFRESAVGATGVLVGELGSSLLL